MVSQGDRVILKGKKSGGIYKLKKENSIQDEVSMTSLEEKSSRVRASRKTMMGREPGQSVAKKRKCAAGRGLSTLKAER